ncbi:TPA: Nuclear transcription factor Y subunit B-3 [Trebouxia sp. C0006]
MKKALPPNAKIAKDAKETVQECVSEFISFVTSEASDKCSKEKRKTINGDDLLWAMSALGFEEYVEPLKMYLHKYREGEKASLAKQGQDANGMKKEEAQPQSLMYPVSCAEAPMLRGLCQHEAYSSRTPVKRQTLLLQCFNSLCTCRESHRA